MVNYQKKYLKYKKKYLEAKKMYGGYRSTTIYDKIELLNKYMSMIVPDEKYIVFYLRYIQEKNPKPESEQEKPELESEEPEPKPEDEEESKQKDILNELNKNIKINKNIYRWDPIQRSVNGIILHLSTFHKPLQIYSVKEGKKKNLDEKSVFSILEDEYYTIIEVLC